MVGGELDGLLVQGCEELFGEGDLRHVVRLGGLESAVQR
jgi:hypothetical protein